MGLKGEFNVLITTNYNQLVEAKGSLSELQRKDERLYESFKNIVELTRQLQFSYQYMGAILMDEETSKYSPKTSSKYIVNLFKRELKMVKEQENFDQLQQLFENHKRVSYTNIAKLVLGLNPTVLVGPALVK